MNNDQTPCPSASGGFEPLTITQVFDLAKTYGLQFRAHYGAITTNDLTPPRPSRLEVRFHCECVSAWRELMTRLTEVPVEISGTRQVSGNGAIDGRLFPGYAAILKDVNAQREAVGLTRVHG